MWEMKRGIKSESRMWLDSVFPPRWWVGTACCPLYETILNKYTLRSCKSITWNGNDSFPTYSITQRVYWTQFKYSVPLKIVQVGTAVWIFHGFWGTQIEGILANPCDIPLHSQAFSSPCLIVANLWGMEGNSCGFYSCVLCFTPPSIYGCQMFLAVFVVPVEIWLHIETHDTCTNCLIGCAHEQIIFQDSNWQVVLLATGLIMCIRQTIVHTLHLTAVKWAVFHICLVKWATLHFGMCEYHGNSARPSTMLDDFFEIVNYAILMLGQCHWPVI